MNLLSTHQIYLFHLKTRLYFNCMIPYYHLKNFYKHFKLFYIGSNNMKGI